MAIEEYVEILGDKYCMTRSDRDELLSEIYDWGGRDEE